MVWGNYQLGHPGDREGDVCTNWVGQLCAMLSLTFSSLSICLAPSLSTSLDLSISISLSLPLSLSKSYTREASLVYVYGNPLILLTV